jgi:hypothetical protein
MKKDILSWNYVKEKYVEFHKMDSFTENMAIDVDFGFWLVNNCIIHDARLSLPDDEAIEQWWAEGKESDKFWQDAPYRTNGDVVEEIKTALNYFITVWQ